MGGRAPLCDSFSLTVLPLLLCMGILQLHSLSGPTEKRHLEDHRVVGYPRILGAGSQYQVSQYIREFYVGCFAPLRYSQLLVLE